MNNFSVKSFYRFCINSSKALLLTLLLTACGGGSGEAPAGSKFNPNLSFETSYTVNEGESVIITFSLDKSTLHDVSFDFVTTTDTARDGEHFHTANGNITIAAGEKIATVTLQTIDNSIAQSLSRFSLHISNIKGANTSDKELTIKINDNEPELSFDNKHTVQEGSNVIINLTLSAPATHRVGVHYQANDGTAKVDLDYKATEGVIFFEPGETSLSVKLNTLLNFTTHDNLNFYFTVTEITGASTALTQSLILITDNEPEISFQNRFLIEEGSPAVITFTLPRSINHTVSLKYETYTNEEDDNHAKAGLDYQHISGVVNVITTYNDDGDIIYQTRIPVYTFYKKLVQSDRVFYFKIVELNGAAVDTNIVTITITDAVENTTYGFEKSHTLASYQAGIVSIKVTKSIATSNTFTVPFEISGTANAGADYTIIGNTETLIFESGQESTSIYINVIDNGLPRSGSTIHLNLLHAGDAELNDTPSHDIILMGDLALNDTGALTGDDAKYGRDSVQALKNDLNDGLAAFSFTKLDYQGNKLSDNNNSFSCVEDNVTGLVYENKQDSQIAYNARLSNDEISRLSKPLNQVTYQDIYNIFKQDVNGETKSDFTNITGRDWDGFSAQEKTQSAFKQTVILSEEEFKDLLKDSPREVGDTLKYTFNAPLQFQHTNWRSKSHSYYWFNTDNNVNGGRDGSKGEFTSSTAPISRLCAFPHNGMINYVSGLKGCNSANYLEVMNNLAVCGFSDWRLPKIEELRSIVNYDINSPEWDARFFPLTNTSGDYLSASPSVNNNATVWCVSGNTGEVKLCHKQFPNLIRAVRGNN
ncbi:MAG: hypothetical protein COA59_08680 [Colwellia sp.]|nr:MAG: hypothetical protein COA59_08680 [Colwellia sp.]